MRRLAVLSAALALVGCHAGPQADAWPGDAGRGREIARRVCAACHGLDGGAVAPEVPKLAGQFPEYLAKQLRAFQAPGRGRPGRINPVMAEVSAGLSEADIADVAAYYAAQAPHAAAPRDAARLALGRRIYLDGHPQNDLPACVTCHRPTGAGMRPDFPRIGGQNPAYLDAELAAWMSTRGHRGKLMSLIAPRLQPDERSAVADYIASLRP